MFEKSPELWTRIRAKWFDHFELLAASRFPMTEELVLRSEAAWRAFFEPQIQDPQLRNILTPQYRFGCRRPLVGNDYYSSMCQSNVSVLGTGIVGTNRDSVIAQDGRCFDVDIIVLATGFNPAGMLGRLDVIGPSGLRLADVWKNNAPEAYFGTLVKGFPNFFMINGPNSFAASLTDMIEAQVGYIISCIDLVKRRNAEGTEVRTAAHDAFNLELQDRAGRSVMALGGCSSWQRANWTGKVFTHWPGSIRSFQHAMSNLKLHDLRLLDADPKTSMVSSRVVGDSGDDPKTESRIAGLVG